MSAEYHAGLDIGASAVKCVVAVAGGNGEPVFSGLGASECKNSVRDGILVDMEGAAAAAARAMEEAEELCGFRIEKILLGVGGAHVRGLMGTGTIGTGTMDEPGVVTEKDVAAALEAAGSIDLPPNSMALDRITRDFAFDRFTGLAKPPVGLQASSVTARVFTVYSDRVPVENLIAMVERIGRKVEALIPSGLAAGVSVLSADEMDLGVVLVDIGSSMTNLVVYRDGGPMHLAAFSMASDHITRDLQRLRLSWVQAERLKVEKAAANDRMSSPNLVMNVPRVGDRGTLQISHPLVTQVVSQRIEAICEGVSQEIRRCGLEPGDLPAGLIITGGGSRTRGLLETAAAVTGLPVETGFPRANEVPTEILRTPEFAVAAGLSVLGCGRGRRHGRGMASGPRKGMLRRVRNFFDTLK
jgi:cell division protein FtsA